MLGGFTDYKVEQWLAEDPGYWVSLHFSHPVVTGAYASELFGGSYGRVYLTFSTPNSRAVYATEDAKWEGLPHARITHIGGWNQQYSGDLEWWAELDTAKVIVEGRGFTLPAGMIALSMS